MPETTREQRRAQQRRRRAEPTHGSTETEQSHGGGHAVEHIVFGDDEVDVIIGRRSTVKNIRFSLAVDKEADFLDLDYFAGTRVGHAWVIITYPDGREDSYGFWPDLRAGGGIDWETFWRDVPGEVRHPDTSHRNTVTAMHTVMIDTEQLVRAEEFAASMASVSYNVLTSQCTTFARAMFEHVIGQPAPSAGLLIDDPSDLAETLSELNAERSLSPLEQPRASRDRKKK